MKILAGVKGGHRTPRTVGWQYYESGEVEKAKDYFTQRDSSIFARNLFPIFVEKNVQFMQAPYSASAQLCWFSQKNIVKDIFGPFDLIPFPDINKIITSINFQVEYSIRFFFIYLINYSIFFFFF